MQLHHRELWLLFNTQGEVLCVCVNQFQGFYLHKALKQETLISKHESLKNIPRP